VIESHVEKLRAVKERVGGYQKLVEALQKRGGEFARIGKSTFYRWESAITDEELPSRARQVIDSLCEIFAPTDHELRIAHHGTPLALSTLLAYQDRKPYPQQQNQEGSKLKAPLTRLGIQGVPVPTKNGMESLQQLHEGKADLAVASADLLREFREDHPGTECRRLCRVASSFMSSISTRRMYVLRHLRDVDRFGYPKGSSLDQNIRSSLININSYNYQEDEKKIIAYTDHIHAANEMAKAGKELFCLVGGASWIAAVRKVYATLTEKRPRCYDVPGDLFGWFHFDAYVRPEHVDPAAVRAFLESIGKVSVDLMKQKSRYRSAALRGLYDLKNLMTADDTDNSAIKEHIASYEAHYETSKVDLKTILRLWNREIHAKRQLEENGTDDSE
jgi:hypothetical protein